MSEKYQYLGDFAATPPWSSRFMQCHACKVEWHGCWDNFQCPKCGEGELPSADFTGFFMPINNKKAHKSSFKD